jgi:imidazolonepropionase-like amidohydrolase
VWLTADGRLIAAVIPNALAPIVAVTPGSTVTSDSLLAAAARHGVARVTPTAASVPADDIAIVGARVVPGDGRPVIEQATVVVRNGRISAVGPSGATAVPRGTRVVDGAGLTVLPGLWDMHAHLKQVEWLPAYLAVGVTTVRDLGNEPGFLLGMRSSLRQGERVGPRILAAGLIDATPATGQPFIGPARRADTPEVGRRLVRRYHALGYDQIKTWANIRPDVLRAVGAEAHRLGLRVTGHVPNGVDAVEGVHLGMDEIAHSGDLVAAMGAGGPEGGIGRRIIEALARAGTVVDPTLVVIRYGTRSRTAPLVTFEPCARDVPGELRAIWDGLASAPEDSAAGEATFRMALRTVGALHRAGVPLVAGSDQGIPGCSLLHELELYVRAGLTPLDAIRTATSVPARVMGLLADLGTIDVGKRADLLVVAGDPTRDIRALRATRHVVVEGRLLSPVALRLLAYPGLSLQGMP